MTLCGCHKEVIEDKYEGINIMVFTDLHYLSKSLYDDGAIFKKLLETNDSKLIERDEEILAWLVDEAIKNKPDVVCMAGDITFNGEVVSLLEVKNKIKEIEDAGIPFLIVPGNHDISYGHAYSYIGDTYEKVDEINQTIFLDNMKEFGYEDAIYKDEASFSYAYEVNEDNWILALDANTEGKIGTLLDETIEWAEEVLKEVSEKGIRVTVLAHQNVLKQNDTIYQGYVMDNHERVERLLKKYGVKLVLSGHSHIQHTSVSGELTDICNESVAVYPLSYGSVKLDAEGYEYSKVAFDDYREEAIERFDENTSGNLFKTLDNYEIDDNIKEEMIQFAKEFNRASFTDDIEALKALKNDERLAYWEKYAKKAFLYEYMHEKLSSIE